MTDVVSVDSRSELGPTTIPLKESVLLYCALPSKDIVGYYIGFGECIGEVLPAPSQTKTLRFLFAFC